MAGKRCTKGKSCGATCIDARERCVLELGPLVAPAVSKVRTHLGDIFMRGIEAGKAEKAKEKAPSAPSDLKRQLAALGPPRQLERSPGARTRTAPGVRRELAVGERRNTPDSKWGNWETKDLEKMQRFFKNQPEGPKRNMQLERIDNELTRRKETQEIVKEAKKGSMDLMMDDISRIMRGSLPENIKIAPADLGSASGDTQWGRSNASDFDKNFKIYKRIRGDKDMINWDETIQNGKPIGEGSFGSVLKVGNMAVKRGEVGAEEANIIKRVGEADIGPKLHGAEISTKRRDGFGVDLHNGRIAMSVVPGKQMGEVEANTKFANKNAADVYWKAMADLHRLGIAHNDAHPGNILVDNKGTGRWVDMGFAQQNPKAALSEALGSFSKSKSEMDGNWQTQAWDATGMSRYARAQREGNLTGFLKEYPVLKRVDSNLHSVQNSLMSRYGFTRKEVDELMDHGIRNDLSSYNQGSWKKLTDKQAQDLLNQFYDGI
jgi:hypothetical protein